MLVRIGAGVAPGASDVIGAIAAAAGVERDTARAIADDVLQALSRHVQKLSLSRGGLADLLEALDALSRSPADTAHAAVLFGGEAGLRSLIAAAQRRGRIATTEAQAAIDLAVENATTLVAARAAGPIGDVYARIPSLFQWSRGSMYADLADIVRRKCGAGPYGRVVLRRRLRAILAQACGMPKRGIVRWYGAQVLAPVRGVGRQVGRLLR